MTLPSAYIKETSMRSGELSKVAAMIESHTEFSDIRMVIDSSPDEQVPEKEIKVTFEIPREISMPIFFRELCKALTELPAITPHKERK